MMALLPPGGKPKEMRLRCARARVAARAAARFAAAFQSTGRPLGLVATLAGGDTVMGSTSGAMKEEVSRGGAGASTGCLCAARIRMKASSEVPSELCRLSVREPLKSTPSTRA